MIDPMRNPERFGIALLLLGATARELVFGLPLDQERIWLMATRRPTGKHLFTVS